LILVPIRECIPSYRPITARAGRLAHYPKF